MTTAEKEDDDIYDFSGLTFDHNSAMMMAFVTDSQKANQNSNGDDVGGGGEEEEEEDWFPPTPPPYDVADKLTEANWRLQNDPVPDVHVAEKVTWRPDSRLVDVRWLDESDNTAATVSSYSSSDFEVIIVDDLASLCLNRETGGTANIEESDATKLIAKSTEQSTNNLPVSPTSSSAEENIQQFQSPPSSSATGATSKTTMKAKSPGSHKTISEESKGRKSGSTARGLNTCTVVKSKTAAKSPLTSSSRNKPRPSSSSSSTSLPSLTKSRMPTSHSLPELLLSNSYTPLSSEESLASSPQIETLSVLSGRSGNDRISRPRSQYRALQRKISRNSLSSNSSSATEDSELRTAAADQAFLQWIQRKREEKRLQERRTYLQLQKLRRRC